MTLRMPAEWEPHEGTWLAWPHNVEHWPGKFEPIPPKFAEITRALVHAGEKVFILVNDETMEEEAAQLIGRGTPNVFFFNITNNTSWTRDFGPIFVRDENNQLVITDWIFNAWGGKYKPWADDDVVPQKIAPLLNLPIIETGIVMEGGALEVNGKGTLITTEQCLLNKNRNPNLTREQIEDYLAKYLGATNVLWLKKGVAGDDTDGHIDDIARFVDERTVVCQLEENEADENHAILKQCFDDLQKMKDQDGNPLRVVPLPMPDPVVYDNQRLPASYANFYIANKAVLVPTFQRKRDNEAIAILKPLFPDRQIIGIDCVDLIWGLGTIHCSTQQQPKA